VRSPSRLSVILAGLVASGLLALGGCSDGPRSEGGYVGADPSITIIAPADREVAPVVTGKSLDGTTTVSSADFQGRVVVVNVWGSWCPPCREEAPALQAASVATKDRAAFIGITTKDYDPAPALAFVRANKITYPSIFDPTGSTLLTFAGTLPPSAIPSTLVIDREGRVAARILSTVTQTTLVDIIDDVAAGR
jgi:thiol-disulfide isomerase/thioredoxin